MHDGYVHTKVKRNHRLEGSIMTLCPKSPSVRGFVVSLPVHLLVKYVYSDNSFIWQVCSQLIFPYKLVFWITESPVYWSKLTLWKLVPALFVQTSEISGLLEPGLTNHHCNTIYFTQFKCIMLYGFKQKANRYTCDKTVHTGALGTQWMGVLHCHILLVCKRTLFLWWISFLSLQLCANYYQIVWSSHQNKMKKWKLDCITKSYKWYFYPTAAQSTNKYKTIKVYQVKKSFTLITHGIETHSLDWTDRLHWPMW